MCTVVTQWTAAQPLRILAIRDEFTTRDFDDPGEWWPTHPGVIGGRDRVAGGSWCVSDVRTGVTALVLNRRERQAGTPSRGVLPLAAVEHGRSWSQHVDHRAMAAFTLVIADREGVTAWGWDAAQLTRYELDAGQHVVTSAGVDAGDEKTAKLAPRFATSPWLDVVTASAPQDDRAALIVRHEIAAGDTPGPGLPAPGAVYATVFGQLITSTPGELTVAYSRTPWLAGTWTERAFPASDGPNRRVSVRGGRRPDRR